MMADDHSLHPPLVPDDVDLRDFPFTPIFRSRLFGSEFHARANDAAWRAGVTLWLKSWDQSPAGTLPDDDISLCRLAELGRDAKSWRKIREMALHGWSLRSDGRLHHKVVAEGVMEAWTRKLEQRWKTECARLKKQAQRQKQDVALPSFDAFVAATFPGTARFLSQGQAPNVPGTSAECPKPVPIETSSKGQGQGQGQERTVVDAGATRPAGNFPTSENPSPPPAAPPPEHIRVGRLVGEAMGVSDDPRWFGDFGRVKAWLDQGGDEALILDVVGRVMAQRGGQGPPKSLKYFDQAIADAIKARTAPLPEPSPLGGDHARRSAPTSTGGTTRHHVDDDARRRGILAACGLAGDVGAG